MFKTSSFFCFPLRRGPSHHTPTSDSDSLQLADKTYVKSCVFCNVSKENGFNILWEVGGIFLPIFEGRFLSTHRPLLE